MNLSAQFPYNLSNLSYQPSILSVVIAMILGIVLFIGLREAFRFTYGANLIKMDQEAIAKKKNTLNDLILMKDIQTELEKEIEQAMLKATFQG